MRAKMIAKRPPLKLVAVLDVILICLVVTVSLRPEVAAQVRHLWNQQRNHNINQQQPPIYSTDVNQATSATISINQEPLGHYAFETAPAMEPPTVRKSPYRSSNELCSGSDLFAGFSPKDTLCGDLNRGSIPVNPLGQSITDQRYPFELIKNKTLQFLARALPVLKSEYESIPKVARYLPANHLLNPTHHFSPLTDSSLYALNQRLPNQQPSYTLVGNENSDILNLDDDDDDDDVSSVVELGGPSDNLFADQFIASHNNINLHNDNNGAHSRLRRWTPLRSGEYIAEMAPNASLVLLSSAHTPHLNRARASGDVSVAVGNGSLVQKYHVLHHQLKLQQQQLKQQRNNNSELMSKQKVSSSHPSSNMNPSSKKFNASLDNDAATTTTSVSDTSNKLPLLQGRSSESQLQSQSQSQLHSQLSVSGSVAPNKPGVELSPAQNGSQNQRQSSPQSSSGANCNEWNGITSVICRATATLVEGDRAPAWLQFAKFFLSSATGGASIGANNGAANEYTTIATGLWSLLGGGSGISSTGYELVPQAKSASSNNIARTSSPPSSQQPSSSGSLATVLLAPIAAYLTGGTGPRLEAGNSSATGPVTGASEHKSALAQLKGSTMARLALAGWTANAIASFVDHYFPTLFQPVLDNRSFGSRRKRPFESSQDSLVDTPASIATSANEYAPFYMRMGAQSTTSGSLQRASTGSGASVVSVNKQPPTPCPSVEEYISPTFARNYQGQWKYVVQVPNEGYFTQTIQRTACVKQKCDFTDGVCHESPRWVSLLVAEIYYPNTVLNAPTDAAHQIKGNPDIQQRISSPQINGNMAMSSSTGNFVVSPQQQQQDQLVATRSTAANLIAGAADPLQMTDSFNMYKHNGQLHYSAGVEPFVGFDPAAQAAVQQQQQPHHKKLATAYNNRFLQRTGQMQQQQQQQQHQAAEARSDATVAASSSQQPLAATAQPQQVINSDYIAALAVATLQQNPHMTMHDLIRSLQMPNARRKRDLHDHASLMSMMQPAAQVRTSSNAPNPEQLVAAAVSSPTPINDISASNSEMAVSSGSQQQQTKKQSHNQLHRQSSMQTVSGQQHNVAAITNHNNNAAVPSSIRVHVQALGNANTANNPQQVAPTDSSINGSAGLSPNNQQVNNGGQECDGYDKIGCYVVRVYYDWFLVNGSCKCWKTSPAQLLTGSPGQQSPTSSSSISQANNSNSFLRRIFTGR